MECNDPLKINQVLIEQLMNNRELTQSLDANQSNPEEEAELSNIIEKVLKNDV